MDEEYVMVIVLECQGQLERHEQHIPVVGYDYEGALELAKILDGSADIYVDSPRDAEWSFIGRCPVCKAQVDGSVEIPDTVQEIPT